MYSKVHHIYATNVQKKIYVLTNWDLFTTSALYKSDYLGFMLYFFFLAR
jgi:hypothetical protein